MIRGLQNSRNLAALNDPGIVNQLEAMAQDALLTMHHPGQMHRYTCPICNATHENSFTISYNQDFNRGLFMRCWRAGCNANLLWLPDDGILPPLKAPDKVSLEQTEFKYDTTELPENVSAFLRNKYHLTPFAFTLLNPSWCEKTKRVIFPVHNQFREHIGYVARKYPEFNKAKSTPKVLNYKINRHFPFQHFTHNVLDIKSVVLVEDMVSAARVAAAGVPAVALLGSSLNEEVLQSLRLVRSCGIALDADVHHKLPSMLKQFKHVMAHWEIFILDRSKYTQDVKDMVPKTLYDVLRTIAPYENSALQIVQ